MLVIARTVAGLFRQMRAQERDLAQFELVRRAYDLGMLLHSGRFEVDGTPFQVHGLGIASVVSQLGASAPVIAAGVLHNAYATGDWADSRERGPFPARRARVRELVGAEVEVVLTGLSAARAARHLDDFAAAKATAERDETARWLILLDLADLADKWDDGRVAYSEDGRSDREFVTGHEGDIVRLAADLGFPDLAAAFDSAFIRMATEEIPDSLRSGRRFSVVVPSPSWRPRRSLVLRRRARRALASVRSAAARRRKPS